MNYVHPFREGNGRTQALYLQQLSGQAGHRLDLTQIDPQGWIEGAITSHHGDYARLGGVIAQGLEKTHELDSDTRAHDAPRTTKRQSRKDRERDR